MAQFLCVCVCVLEAAIEQHQNQQPTSCSPEEGRYFPRVIYYDAQSVRLLLLLMMMRNRKECKMANSLLLLLLVIRSIVSGL